MNRANHLAFGRSYMTFASATEPYQRADDVGFVVAGFMSFKGEPFYPTSALASARVASTHLSANAFDHADEDNLDLIFRMPEAEGGHFFEIVLRTRTGTRYGGWLWGHDVEVTDEIIEGYRVLMTSAADQRWRYEHCQISGRYHSIGQPPVGKSLASERQ